MANGRDIAVAPRSADWIDAAIEAGGGRLVDVAAADALVWTHSRAPEDLAEVIGANPGIGWVQLPWAGVEPYLRVMDRDRIWTNAKIVYGPPVAEHALALLLALFRNLGAYARADSWTRQGGRNLYGARVAIVGGGGIARSLVELLAPFGCDITIIRRRDIPFDAADRVITSDRLAEGIEGADALVLALPSLQDTKHLIAAAELDLLAPGACIVNVARGSAIDHDALLAALRFGRIGGAGLDVTDPEPLPDSHPLWAEPNVIITPHTANTLEMSQPLLGGHITANVARWIAGEPLEAVVDLDLGY